MQKKKFVAGAVSAAGGLLAAVLLALMVGQGPQVAAGSVIALPAASSSPSQSISPSPSRSVSPSPSQSVSPSPSQSVSPTPTLSTSPSPTRPGGEGCTPGYWKNHPESWPIPTTTTVGSVFTGAGSYASTTLLAALSFKGGSGLDGARRILLRAAAAAYLNSLAVDYAYSPAQVVNLVNDALASGDRATMIDVAARLDAANNAGCPLN